MRIIRLTPEQAQIAGRALAAAARWMARLFEAMREWARRTLEALREAVALVRRVRPVLECRDRPAWQSPYGPPRRR